METDEQRRVFFRYERLPNFCYLCGMLGHGEKECDKDGMTRTREEKGAYQYGAWLPLSHVTIRVGEPHMSGVVGSSSGASDTLVSHPKVTPKLPISELAKSSAWSSELDPTEGYVTKAELSQKQVNSGGNVSLNPAKSNTLGASEVH